MSSQKKKIARRKRLEKEKNLRKNLPRFRFRLEINLGDEGWIEAKMFRTDKEASAYLIEIEGLRRKNVEIIEGRIIDIDKGVIASVIPAHTPSEVGPTMEEAAKIPKEKFTRQ